MNMARLFSARNDQAYLLAGEVTGMCTGCFHPEVEADYLSQMVNEGRLSEDNARAAIVNLLFYNCPRACSDVSNEGRLVECEYVEPAGYCLDDESSIVVDAEQ